MEKRLGVGRVFRSVVLCAVLLTGFARVGSGAEPATGIPMSTAEMARKATEQSADKHRIEMLPGGRARVPAPLQAMEATAAPEGITVISTEKKEPGTFTIRAASLGRAGDKLAPLPLGKVSVDGQLARITRPGLVEELTTSADGVRQDFVVAAAPKGNGDLVLELDVTGALLDKSDDAARLTLESGRELLYHRLLVTDSAGRNLPARFELAGLERLRIVVADAGASYPIRIDPTITDADWVSISLPGTNGYVRALQVAGTSLYAAGEFTAIGGIATNRIAQWNGSSWSALGSGMDYNVYALAWDGTNLYAGGQFTTAGGTGANGLAKWNGSSWSVLGSGISSNSIVYALVWGGSNLYVGGTLFTAGGIPVAGIARWDGSSWSALGAGIYGYVNALAWDGTNLYAGGEFTMAGLASANRITKWDGSSWSALGSGMNNSVKALAWDGTNLYAGGYFTTAGGTSANYIAKWNGNSWSALGTGMGGGFTPHVAALAWDGTNLYAGGDFTTAGGGSANFVAKWNGSSWSTLGSGIGSTVYALAGDGTTFYAGGQFTTAGGASANYIANWNGNSWSALDGGMNGNVSALAWDGTNLYAGGSFTTIGGTSARCIAKWDGSSWSALGSGMLYGYVNALVWGGTNLYAGGDFAIAGGVFANGIAKWNGSNWSALGSGMDRVFALAWDGTNLYAGGWFASAGGTSANRIAKWDGSSWSALGSGMDYNVYALAWDGTNLYAGGQFTTAGGTGANSIAKWNGSSWSALGSGMNGNISVLAWDGTNLYAGGGFSTAGGTSVNNLAKWNGSSWSALGSGIGSTVSALAWDGTNLYAGGSFSTAGGVSANRIAKWNGSNWSALGSGMDTSVYALALGGTNLYAGGPFNIAGGKSARVAYVELGRTVTATAGANGSISSANPLTAFVDSTASFTLAPAATYQPSSTVTGDCPAGSWNGNIYTTGPIVGNCTVGFSFVKITYPLTVTFQGTGNGTVTMLPNPPASNCSSTCSQSLEINTSVQLTAAPDGGSVFTSWSGCDTVTNNFCTVTMNQAKSVTATFSLSGPINGVCGNSNGQLISSPPTDYLCAMGTPSEPSGAGPWSWTCSGINGGIPASCATISIDAGLVASYPFNGNAGDSSGNGNNGTVNGAMLTTDRLGNGDRAFAFDGSGSYLLTPHSGSLGFTDAFTFSTWVNFNQVNRTADGYDRQAIIAKKKFSQFGLILSTDPTGNLVFYHDGLTPNQSSYNWADVQPDTWYHLTVTYDGSKIRQFINGVLKAETAVSGTLAANTDDLYIGKSLYSDPESPWEYPVDGKLDDIRFYNRPLNAAEVTALYQATFPLSFTITGEGTGAVHSTPAPDISCLAGACSQNYSAGTVVNLTASAAAGSVFTGWSGDCSGPGVCSVTMDRARSVIAGFSRAGDILAPLITAFNMPAMASDLTVPVTAFTATDNVGVTGFLITQDAIAPSANASGWSASAPTSHTFLAPGNCYAYAWARDAAGNVSGAGAAVVNITISAPSDTVVPLITSFLVPSANSLTSAITAFAVIDNVGVTGYLVSETGMSPLVDDPRWASTAPGSYTFTAYGAKTLYAWAKDAAGNISARVTAYTTLLDPAQTIDTLLTGWPGNPATSSPSTFTFTTNQSGATFECNMDGQSWYACTSPASFGALANGGHMFSVRAKSSGGSYDPSPVSFIWTVAVPLVQMNLTAYTSLTDAYSDSSSGSILKIKGMEFGTVPAFDRPVTITLQGGYDSAFTGASGTSTLHGTLTISAGTITFDGITVQ